MSGRRGHANQRGMTLIELLITIGLVGILMGAVVIGFDIGIKAVGHGGAGDRAAAARDLSSFEQQLSMDISRAGCISVGSTAYGACSHSVAPSGTVISACASAKLCVAWSQIVGSPGAPVGCHIDAYTQPGGAKAKVIRTEYLGSTSTALHGASVTTADGVTLAIATSPPPQPPFSGTQWVAQVTATITGAGVVNSPPSAVLQMQPMTADPGAQTETVLC